MERTVIHKPPYYPTFVYRVFLAGSIEMGVAENWQSEVQKVLPEGVQIFNPRRDDWDSSWVQDISDDNFRTQVEWELDMLDKSDLIAMYLQPGTMSPISLLELGLYAKSGKMIVCCPEGFWRRGNVQIVCDQNDIPLHSSFEVFLQDIELHVKLQY